MQEAGVEPARQQVQQVGLDHRLGDQSAFEALIRFADEELKHQALFRRIEDMLDAAMPAGWTGPRPSAGRALSWKKA